MDPQLLSLGIALLLGGCLAGFSAGLFGIGGGAILVPVLYYTFAALGYSEDVIMHMAVATSASVIVVTSIRSAHGHNKHGAVDWSLVWPKNPLRSWGIWIGVGALLAAALVARALSGTQLTMLFGIVIGVLALQFIFGRPDWRLANDVPRGIAPPVAGTTLGGLCALMGIGFGSIGVTLMILCGRKIHQAIGTAAAIGFFIGLPATFGYIYAGLGVDGRPPLSVGYVNMLGFAIMAVATLLMVPLGVRTAHGLSQKRMRMVFGIFLLIIAANMMRKAMTG
ncbi:MAG: sulfite exporter TauE/SafE family protein [Hyphomonadaceae bacterium]|nr:sulfite exporter TauE/SafE family protein [Hyphomonadaceae bacterium]